jgi:hypothetical protein
VSSYLAWALLDVIHSQQSVGAAVRKPCHTGTDTPCHSENHESDTKWFTLPRLGADDAQDEGEDGTFGEAKG